jgi:hypothetical protein
MMDRDGTVVSPKRGRCLAAAITFAVLLLGAQATSSAAGKLGSGAALEARAGQAAPTSNAASAAHRVPSPEPSYASREAKSKGLETFKGGDVVVIGAGGLVIILLIVRIIVIL